MTIAVIKGFIAVLLSAYVDMTWVLLISLFQFLIGLFIELPLLGFGTRKIVAECFNIKDATVTGSAYRIGQGHFKFYVPNLKIPTYRYIVDGKLYVSDPVLVSNLPGYNPVAGPCTIRVKKSKPWKMISPLRHTVASILYALALGWLVLPGILSLADADFQKILHPASENVSITELMNEMKPSYDYEPYGYDDYEFHYDDDTEDYVPYESLYPSTP